MKQTDEKTVKILWWDERFQQCQKQDALFGCEIYRDEQGRLWLTPLSKRIDEWQGECFVEGDDIPIHSVEDGIQEFLELASEVYSQ